MSGNFRILSLADVSVAFDALISGTKSREEIAAWAANLVDANDEGNLIYDPISSRHITWRAVKYLSGVDLKDSPYTYLHTVEDFLVFRKKLSI